MNSRQLLRKFVRGGPCARTLLLATAFYHAARIDGVGFAALAGDPTRLTRALLDQHRLLGTDAVPVHFDSTLFARAAGLDVDWSAAVPTVEWKGVESSSWPPAPQAVQAAAAALVDVTGRLAQELRRQVPVLAVLPGPAALAGAGDGGAAAVEAATIALRELVEAACRAGAEAVLVQEATADWDEAVVRERLAPIVNTVRYYNAAALVTAPRPPAGKLGDAVLLPPETSPAAAPDDVRLGFTIPRACFDGDDELAAFAEALAGRRAPAFLVVGDAVLTACPVERNVAVLSALRDVAHR